MCKYNFEELGINNFDTEVVSNEDCLKYKECLRNIKIDLQEVAKCDEFSILSNVHVKEAGIINFTVYTPALGRFFVTGIAEEDFSYPNSYNVRVLSIVNSYNTIYFNKENDNVLKLEIYDDAVEINGIVFIFPNI